MAFTYDPTGSTGRVRMLVQDKEEDHAFFSDEELAAYLDMNDDNVRRAAADALDSMASSEAYVQKRMSLLELSTDGPATATALRAHANQLRTQADNEEAGEDGGMFDYAEMADTEFQRRERVVKQAQRDE
jgi:hypothetical protein